MDLVEDGGQEDRGRRDIQGRQVERRFIRPVRGRQNWLTQALRWAAAPSWRRMAETNHDGCEQECGGWEEGFADALAGIQEWSITVHDGICRCEFCVTGIALIEAALGDMAGILREIRGELKPVPSPPTSSPSPDPPEGVPALRRCSSTAARELAIRPGRNPWPASGVAGATSAALETKCPVLPGDSPRIHPVCLIGAKQRLQAGVPPGVEEERLQGLVQNQRQVAPSPGYLGQLLLVAEAVT